MTFVPLCDSSNLNSTEPCAVPHTSASGASYSVQMFLTLFLIIGMLVLLILFVSRIRSILSAPKSVTTQLQPAGTSTNTLLELTHHSHSPTSPFYYLTTNGQLQATPTILSQIRTDMLAGGSSSRLQFGSLPNLQQCPSYESGISIEMIMLELPPPSYKDVVKCEPDKPEANAHHEMPPPSYSQL